MLKKVLVLTTIVSALAASKLQAEQISASWDGGGDGHSWGDPYNWDPDIVPDNQGPTTFAVIIDINNVDINIIQNRTIDYLEVDGDGVEISDSDLHVCLTFIDPNGLTNYGELHIGGDGRFDIVGQVTNTDNAELKFWWVEIEGSLYNSSGAELELGSHFEINGEYFQNDGGLFISPTCSEVSIDSDFRNTGQVRLFDSPVDFEIFENIGIVKGFGFIGSDIFQNSGTLENKVGSSIHIVVGATDSNNLGYIFVNTDGSITFDCNLVNEPNGVIELLGGTLAVKTITQQADSTFEGFGGITGDVVIDPNGLIKLTGPTNVVGDVEIGTNATLEISDGSTLITGHTTCNNGTIHMIGGRVICQGGLTNNNCNIIWEPGTYTNMADFNLDGTVNFKDFAYFGDTWLWKADWY